MAFIQDAGTGGDQGLIDAVLKLLAEKLSPPAPETGAQKTARINAKIGPANGPVRLSPDTSGPQYQVTPLGNIPTNPAYLQPGPRNNATAGYDRRGDPSRGVRPNAGYTTGDYIRSNPLFDGDVLEGDAAEGVVPPDDVVAALMSAQSHDANPYFSGAPDMSSMGGVAPGAPSTYAPTSAGGSGGDDSPQMKMYQQQAQAQRASADAAKTGQAIAGASQQNGGKVIKYQVQKGDTYAKIASKIGKGQFGALSVMQQNGGGPLKVGDTLEIPEAWLTTGHHASDDWRNQNKYQTFSEELQKQGKSNISGAPSTAMMGANVGGTPANLPTAGVTPVGKRAPGAQSPGAPSSAQMGAVAPGAPGAAGAQPQAAPQAAGSQAAPSEQVAPVQAGGSAPVKTQAVIDPTTYTSKIKPGSTVPISIGENQSVNVDANQYVTTILNGDPIYDQDTGQVLFDFGPLSPEQRAQEAQIVVDHLNGQNATNPVSTTQGGKQRGLGIQASKADFLSKDTLANPVGQGGTDENGIRWSQGGVNQGGGSQVTMTVQVTGPDGKPQNAEVKTDSAKLIATVQAGKPIYYNGKVIYDTSTWDDAKKQAFIQGVQQSSYAAGSQSDPSGGGLDVGPQGGGAGGSVDSGSLVTAVAGMPEWQAMAELTKPGGLLDKAGFQSLTWDQKQQMANQIIDAAAMGAKKSLAPKTSTGNPVQKFNPNVLDTGSGF